MPIGNPVTLTSNVASKVISITATASQTVFTIEGGYRINQISVYRNGTRLADSLDYTARDGASVTLLSPATLADVLEFQVFDDFRVADAIVSAASNQTIFGNLTVTGTLTGGPISGATIGIQSGGTVVGTAKTLNFVGTGNTFAVNGDTIDVSIAGGGGGGGLGTAINYADGSQSPFSFIDAEVTVTSNLNLDATNAGATTSYVVSVIPNIIIGAGIAVTVGVGKTMVIDILNLGDL
jgi:hypothetical protein